MRPRKLLGILAALLLLLVGGYAVWWWQVARAVERGVAAWEEARRANGAVVEDKGLSVTGFPFTVRATLEAPHLATRGAEWTGARLVAEAPPWNHTRIALTLPGEQRLTVVRAGLVPLTLLAKGGGQGHVLLTLAGQPVELRLGFADVVAQPDVTPVPVASLEVTATQPPEPPASHTDTGLALTVTAHGVTLPEEAPGSLGRRIDEAVLSARLLGRPPRPDPAGLSAWSRDGGSVELDRLGLDWGPLKLSMNGTLALDGNLQPEAALTAQVQGMNAVLDAVQGQFKPKEVALARTVLTMLARPTGPDGAPVITAPVTVQNRSLFLGPLKVASLPLVTW